MSFRQKTVPTGNKLCRPAIKCADRQTKVPMAAKTSRWPLATAGGVWGCLTRHSLPLQGKTRVFGAKPDTKRSSSEILRQGTRAETSGNSKRTHTWMITECSNGDAQVLRTVKNGVSTACKASKEDLHYKCKKQMRDALTNLKQSYTMS